MNMKGKYFLRIIQLFIKDINIMYSDVLCSWYFICKQLNYKLFNLLLKQKYSRIDKEGYGFNIL